MNRYTSDFHGWHNNIIKYSNRPFGSVDEMNITLLDNLRGCFNPEEDTLYYLGDLSFGNYAKVKWFFDQVMEITKGKVIWIMGNHDEHLKKILKENNIKYYQYLEIRDGNYDLVLCHYPMEDWNGCGNHHGKEGLSGSYMIHGHCHKDLPSSKGTRRIDCGVDVLGFRPHTIHEIVAAIDARNGA